MTTQAKCQTAYKPFNYYDKKKTDGEEELENSKEDLEENEWMAE